MNQQKPFDRFHKDTDGFSSFCRFAKASDRLPPRTLAILPTGFSSSCRFNKPSGGINKAIDGFNFFPLQPVSNSEIYNARFFSQLLYFIPPFKTHYKPIYTHTTQLQIPNLKTNQKLTAGKTTI